MFPEEIVKILQKYQDNNQKELTSINEDIQDIILQLKYICSSLSHDIQKLIDTGIIHDNEDELFQDTKTLRNFINSINLLNISDNTSANIEEVSEELSPIIFDKKVYPYLISDDICPFCNYKMSHHLVHYQRIVNSQIKNEDVMWNRCSLCKRLFVLDYDAEEFDFNDTNVILNKEKYDTIPPIDIYTVIVLSNTLKCSSNHKTKDLLAKIPVLDENGLFPT